MVRAIASRCFSPPEKAVTAFSDHGVVPVRQRRDVVVDLRGLRRRVQLLVGGVGLGEAQVVRDRRVEEVRLLRDDAHRAGQGVEVEVAHVHPVQGDPPARDVVQPGTR
ncbi:hypothetical protein STENM223S_11165 [Streptomyces tendae]